jgi:hypothetical protein
MGTMTLVANGERAVAEVAKTLPLVKVQQARALIPAFVGLVILGFALIGLTWWAFYRLRRRMRNRLGSTKPIHDPWYRKAEPSDLPPEPDEPRP